MLKPEADKRKASTQAKPGSGKVGGGKLQSPGKGKTRDAVGSAVGLSGRTYARAKVVVAAAKADPALILMILQSVLVEQRGSGQANRFSYGLVVHPSGPSASDIIPGFATLQHGQNLPDHDARAPASRFAVANLRIGHDEPAKFDSLLFSVRSHSIQFNHALSATRLQAVLRGARNPALGSRGRQGRVRGGLDFRIQQLA